MHWHRILVAGLLAFAVDARAQSHEPATPSKAAPAKTTAAKAAPAPGAAAGHDAAAEHAAASTGHDAPAAKKKTPTVSRLAPLAPAAAKPDDDHAPAAAHAPAGAVAPASAAHGTSAGYVATGARARASAGGADHGDGPARSKPVVSGLGAGKATAPAGTTHAAAPDQSNAHEVSPAAGAAPHPAAAAHAPAKDAESTGARKTTPSRPARLADVHERLAAALAELRTPADHGAGADSSGGAAHADAPGAHEPRRQRVTLSWPKPRWQVAWPAPGRVALTWPEPAPLDASALVPPPH